MAKKRSLPAFRLEGAGSVSAVCRLVHHATKKVILGDVPIIVTIAQEDRRKSVTYVDPPKVKGLAKKLSGKPVGHRFTMKRGQEQVLYQLTEIIRK